MSKPLRLYLFKIANNKLYTSAWVMGTDLMNAHMNAIKNKYEVIVGSNGLPEVIQVDERHLGIDWNTES